MEIFKEILGGLEEKMSAVLIQGEGTQLMLEVFAQRVDERLDRIEARLDRIEERVDRVEVRLDQIEVRLDRIEERFDEIEVRFDRLEHRVDKNESSLEILTNLSRKIVIQLSDIKAELIKINAATRYNQYHEDQKKFNIGR